MQTRHAGYILSRARAKPRYIAPVCMCLHACAYTPGALFNPTLVPGGRRERIRREKSWNGGDDGIASGARFDEFAGAVCV